MSKQVEVTNQSERAPEVTKTGRATKLAKYFANTLPATILLMGSIAGMRLAPMLPHPWGTIGQVLMLLGIDAALLLYIYPVATEHVKQFVNWQRLQHDRDKLEREATALEELHAEALRDLNAARIRAEGARTAKLTRLEYGYERDAARTLFEDAILGGYLDQIDLANAGPVFPVSTH